MYRLLNGDCLNILPTLEENSIDAIVTDPPYGLSFMGKHWDHGVPGEAFWREALRVAKPGAHLLAFGGSRTVHRLTCAIEDAGWEIRDTIMWVYGSGFPKSHNVSKAIDREAGAEREVIGTIRKTPSASSDNMHEGWRRPWAEDHPKTMDITDPATPLARQWDGWGTALKPAHEPIIMARKPFPGTVAQNVTTWGTGAINVDGGRVGTEQTVTHGRRNGTGNSLEWSKTTTPSNWSGGVNDGRWPANLIHDGSEEAAGPLNGAARFFYCAKASKADRDEGLEGFTQRSARHAYGDGLNSATKIRTDEQAHGGVNRDLRSNHHPTVKPTDLMRYLVRLVTPPNGIILDPFMGSGSTGKAAILEGFGFVGIEREREYIDIAKARIGAAVADKTFGLFNMAAD